jgi:hypothetical protein
VRALLAAGDEGAVAAALTSDALVIDGDTRASGPGGSAHLAGVVDDVEVTSAIDSHHDVLRARVKRDGKEQMLFGALTDDRLRLVVLTAVPKDGEITGDGTTKKYGDAWNEPDADARAKLIDASWSENGRYVDPTADVTGRSALAAHIAEFRDSLPGAAVVPTSKLEESARAVHFRWLTSGLAGLVSIEGMDIGLVDEDGRLELIAGFFGPVESHE